jgi:uncharacterized protein YqeY
MSLGEKIQKDMTDAMKAREELRLSVLRMIKAALKHKEVEKIRPLEESEAIQVLQTLVKKSWRSSNPISPPAQARPKWTEPSAKPSPRPEQTR